MTYRDLLRRHEKASHRGKSGKDIVLKDDSSTLQSLHNPAAPSRSTQSSVVNHTIADTSTPGHNARSKAGSQQLESDFPPGDNDLGFVNGLGGAQVFPNQLTNSMPSDTNTIFGEHYEHQDMLPSGAVIGSTVTSPLMAIDHVEHNPENQEIDFAGLYAQLDSYDRFLDLTDYSTLIPGDCNFEPTFEILPRDFEHTNNVLSEPRQPENCNDSNIQKQNGPDASFSRFGSPLPSLQGEPKEIFMPPIDQAGHPQRIQPCWKISGEEYHCILSRIGDFSHVLPKDFIPLSRHTMSRYLEGSIKGLCDHLPFLHIPTFTVSDAAPELILSLAAIGAQFRFEDHRAPMLFYAAKAVVQEQVQRRERQKVEAFLCRPTALFSGSVSVSEGTSAPPLQISKCVLGSDRLGSNDMPPDSELQTAQALIALLVMGAWGPQQLVREAVSLQSLAATLARNDGFSGLKHGEGEHSSLSSSKARHSNWKQWIEYEREKRTKLMIYCMLNLISVAYHIPPLILTSEINCCLPGSANEWNAKTSQEWEVARRSSTIIEAPFQESFNSQFRVGQGQNNNIRLSPLANYTLILALLQHIFLRRQTSAGRKNALDSEDIVDISRALRCWQERWERSPESTIDPTTVTGPVAFNSTALLRLAWIRLYADLGPCRYLASRDVSLIVSAFAKCPPLESSPSLIHPVLQAAHALSIPVRMGIKYVAKTQTVSWSVQHSISNLECAIFLSKWLEKVAVASATQPLEREEQRIVGMIHSLLLETGLFEDDWIGDITERQGQKQKIRQLATAVARMWAEIFKGTHVFEVVNTIGASIAAYAGSMESAYSPVNPSG